MSLEPGARPAAWGPLPPTPAYQPSWRSSRSVRERSASAPTSSKGRYLSAPRSTSHASTWVIRQWTQVGIPRSAARTLSGPSHPKPPAGWTARTAKAAREVACSSSRAASALLGPGWGPRGPWAGKASYGGGVGEASCGYGVAEASYGFGVGLSMAER